MGATVSLVRWWQLKVFCMFWWRTTLPGMIYYSPWLFSMKVHPSSLRMIQAYYLKLFVAIFLCSLAIFIVTTLHTDRWSPSPPSYADRTTARFSQSPRPNHHYRPRTLPDRLQITLEFRILLFIFEKAFPSCSNAITSPTPDLKSPLSSNRPAIITKILSFRVSCLMVSVPDHLGGPVVDPSLLLILRKPLWAYIQYDGPPNHPAQRAWRMF